MVSWVVGPVKDAGEARRYEELKMRGRADVGRTLRTSGQGCAAYVRIGGERLDVGEGGSKPAPF